MQVRKFALSLAIPFSAIAFAVRAAAFFVFSYGSPFTAATALAASLLYALLAIREFVIRRQDPVERGWDGVAKPSVSSTLINLSPFLLFSLLSLSDSITLGKAAASPWPLLVLVPAVLDAGRSASFSLYAAALPAACGVVDAAGAFSGTSRPQALLSLVIAMIAAAFARAAGRERQAALVRAASEHIERERALASKRDGEVEIAARIQRKLLLDTPDIVCRDLSVEAITVASNAVDGDFYAFIPYSTTSMDILVGDVMGKGVPAALLGAALKGAFLRSSLRLLVSQPEMVPRPEAIVAAVHESVVQELMSLESFVTLQYARLDASKGRMDFVDCGHTPILHFDASLGLCWHIKGTDLPLGFSEEKNYARYALPVAAGDRLVFHSDGIMETANGSGDLFGEERLADIVAANATAEPRELLRRILKTAMFFAADEGFRDDVTCVAVSVDRVPSPPLRSTEEFPAQLSSLPEIRIFLEDALRGEDEDLSARVILVACELVSNAVRHGVPGWTEASEKVEAEAGISFSAEDFEDAATAKLPAYALPGPLSLRLECLRAAGWVAIRLIHHGEAFPWHRGAKALSMESFPSGGIGRALISSAADSVLYAVGGGGGAAGDLLLACALFERS